MVTLYAYEVFPAEKLPIGQGLMSFLERSPASGIWYAKPNDGYTSLTLFAISAPATKSTERVIAIRYNTKDFSLIGEHKPSYPHIQETYLVSETKSKFELLSKQHQTSSLHSFTPRDMPCSPWIIAVGLFLLRSEEHTSELQS